MTTTNPEFVALPKVLLHDHLDGGLRPATVIELAAQIGHELPSTDTEDLQRIGVHTCPGGDRDATHSADIDYAELLPDLFELQATNFYIQMASEQDRPRVLTIIARCAKPYQRIFIGVTDPINPRVETAEEVKERVLEAAVHIPVTQLGTTDDCGFSPFSDDTSTGRKTAFSKIRARVAGTEMAAACLGI